MNEKAMNAVKAWLSTNSTQVHLDWWKDQLKRLRSDPGALAEIRAFGALLSNSDEITHVPVRPHPRADKTGRTADFLLGGDIPVHVEVCCLCMNDNEGARQRKLDEVQSKLVNMGRQAAEESLPEEPGSTVMASATWEQAGVGVEGPSVQRHAVQTVAVRRTDGRPTVISTSMRYVRPQGPDKGGAVHTFASRIAGKKPPGQIPSSSPGILWMDCCDPDWALSAQNTQPAEVFWKGMNLATTRGVWHAFYGKKNVTPMMEHALVGFDFQDKLHSQFSLQHFDGRFRSDEGGCWSAAVLRCTDGLVIFENPQPIVQLPFSVLRGLTALRGYNPVMSFHRLSDDGADDLRRVLENAEQRLWFYARGSA